MPGSRSTWILLNRIFATKKGMIPDTTQSLRLFYALWPDDVTRAALANLQVAISGRRTPYENLHLTLAFLGQQPAALLPALREILTDLPKANMTLVLDRIGYFTKSRIAWVGMHAAPHALFDLQRQLMSKLAQQNIIADTRSPFRPHVTLARNAAAPADTPFLPIHWHATDICLVESSLEADRARYRVIASNKL
jgi:2'-5' RNA ligase